MWLKTRMRYQHGNTYTSVLHVREKAECNSQLGIFQSKHKRLTVNVIAPPMSSWWESFTRYSVVPWCISAIYERTSYKWCQFPHKLFFTRLFTESSHYVYSVATQGNEKNIIGRKMPLKSFSMKHPSVNVYSIC